VSRQRLPIASLVKSLRVLEELALAGNGSSVAELIQRTGLERTTVQRVLTTLHAEGYVERTARGEYGVAARGFVLGAMLSQGSHLAAASEPILSGLQREVGEAVHLAILDGTEVVCVGHVPAGKLLAFTFPVGSRLPAYSSSLGRCILAYTPRDKAMQVLRASDRRKRTAATVTSLQGLAAELDKVRRQGYCRVESEVELGVSSVAAPVLGPKGEALAALNVVVPAARIESAEHPEQLVPAVIRAAASLSGHLGWNRDHGAAAEALAQIESAA
jgi:IclR family transcriptional regulator, pca regulon regulatory protein